MFLQAAVRRQPKRDNLAFELGDDFGSCHYDSIDIFFPFKDWLLLISARLLSPIGTLCSKNGRTAHYPYQTTL
jgi:hypothetical protein